MVVASADLHGLALEAVPAAKAALRRRPGAGTDAPPSSPPADPALILEATVFGLAAVDAHIMLAIEEADLEQHQPAFFEYLRDAWGYDAADLDDLLGRLTRVALPGEARPARTRMRLLESRDRGDRVVQRLAEILGDLAAFAAPSDARRLERERARLDRYRARYASEAEMARVLDIADRLLAGRKPPVDARPRFKPGALEEGRRQAEAGLGRPIEDVLRDLAPRPPAPR